MTIGESFIDKPYTYTCIQPGKVEFVSYSTWSSFMISKVSNFPFVALHNAMHFGQPVIHYDKYIAEFCDGIRDGFFKIFRIKK